MEYVFPGNGYECINDQFLLGDEILVAPIIEKNTYSRTVVFPAGKWQNEDMTVDGPVKLNLEVPIDKLLWFKKITD